MAWDAREIYFRFWMANEAQIHLLPPQLPWQMLLIDNTWPQKCSHCTMHQAAAIFFWSEFHHETKLVLREGAVER